MWAVLDLRVFPSYPIQIQEREASASCGPGWGKDVLFAAGQAPTRAEQETNQDLLTGVSRGCLKILYVLLSCEILDNTLF